MVDPSGQWVSDRSVGKSNVQYDTHILPTNNAYISIIFVVQCVTWCSICHVISEMEYSGVERNRVELCTVECAAGLSPCRACGTW